MIQIAQSADPAVRRILARHPRVEFVEDGPYPGVRFRQGDWEREVVVGGVDVEPFGLVELMDNNPIVCADRMAVPSPVATLALIALGPLASASLIAESPIVIASHEASEDEVAHFLASAGWTDGATLHHEPVDLNGVVAATVMVSIHTPENLDEIDDLYEERFGRSFFVRRNEESEWDPGLVAGTPYALYRLRIAPDQPTSLLTIRVLADLDGKAGAAQVVHAMNVMHGVEEGLGVQS